MSNHTNRMRSLGPACLYLAMDHRCHSSSETQATITGEGSDPRGAVVVFRPEFEERALSSIREVVTGTTMVSEFARS